MELERGTLNCSWNTIDFTQWSKIMRSISTQSAKNSRLNALKMDLIALREFDSLSIPQPHNYHSLKQPATLSILITRTFRAFNNITIFYASVSLFFISNVEACNFLLGVKAQ